MLDAATALNAVMHIVLCQHTQINCRQVSAASAQHSISELQGQGSLITVSLTVLWEWCAVAKNFISTQFG